MSDIAREPWGSIDHIIKYVMDNSYGVTPTPSPLVEAQDRYTISIKIKHMLQRVHNDAPKDKSADFYEGLSFALSLMEQQA